MTDDIEERVRGYITQNFLLAQSDTLFENDTSFLESGIIDSSGVLEIIAFIEHDFDVQITDEEMIPENLDSVNNIVQMITRKKS